MGNEVVDCSTVLLFDTDSQCESWAQLGYCLADRYWLPVVTMVAMVTMVTMVTILVVQQSVAFELNRT